MRKAKDLPVLRAVAAEIKARRAALNISQEELAHRAEVHRSYVARLEVARNQPTIGVLFRLAESCETDVVELTRGIAERVREEMRSARRSRQRPAP